ncbi:unnamed protein product [Absidia cylindrospora]
MGAQASKQVARKLPKTARPETLRSTPRESPSTLKQAQQYETHENLAKLGPVTVPPTITRMRQSDSMLGILRERQRIEKAEESDSNNKISSNRITTDELFSILEHRKHLPPNALEDHPEKWQELSKECGGVDVSALQTLFKYYNTITVMPPANSEDKSERRQGVWVRDRQEWKHFVNETQKQHQLNQQAKENALRDNGQKTDQPQSQEERRERHLKDLFVD